MGKGRDGENEVGAKMLYRFYYERDKKEKMNIPQRLEQTRKLSYKLINIYIIHNILYASKRYLNRKK